MIQSPSIWSKNKENGMYYLQTILRTTLIGVGTYSVSNIPTSTCCSSTCYSGFVYILLLCHHRRRSWQRGRPRRLRRHRSLRRHCRCRTLSSSMKSIQNTQQKMKHLLVYIVRRAHKEYSDINSDK